MTHRQLPSATIYLSLLAIIFLASPFAQQASYAAEPATSCKTNFETTYFHNLSIGGQERTGKRISISEAGSVKGRVLSGLNTLIDAAPEPIAGVRVILRKMESDGTAVIEGNCITDAKGQYDLSAPSAGIYSIDVDPISIPSRFVRSKVKAPATSPAPTTEAKVQDAGTSSQMIKGKVFVDKNGDGKYDAKVDETVAGAFITASGRFTVSDQDGLYTLAQLPTGRTSVVASVPGVNKNSQVLFNLDHRPSSARIVDIAVGGQRSATSNDEFNLLETEDSVSSERSRPSPTLGESSNVQVNGPSAEKVFLSPTELSTPVSKKPNAQRARFQPESKGSPLRGYSSGDDQVDSYIVEFSRRYRIDPLLIYAQMAQESSFKPRALSHKGATGLMQLMPATARRLGVSNIHDSRQNIEGGVKYMRILLDMFGGNINLALAGYNAGEGAVVKYGNRIPPYRETQDYVRRISSRYSKISGSPVPNFEVQLQDDQTEAGWTVPPPPDGPETGAEMLRRYQRPPIASKR